VGQISVTIIECLRDNYAYLLQCPVTGECAVVDPSEEAPVVAAIEALDAPLIAILNTHHHWDHTGGNEALLTRWPDLEVYGHVSDEGRIPGQTKLLGDGDRFQMGRQSVLVKHIPGHTLGAVAYCFERDVFTGDTLFYGGCGRLFEGSPQMMFHSLTERLGNELSLDTRFWCGHEYTVQNLRFARRMNPENEEIVVKLDWALKERESGRPTVPSTLADELAVNPFMRAQSADELRDLRQKKDVFRS
jgi:hydroxyacylglutathione hydrolase